MYQSTNRWLIFFANSELYRHGEIFKTHILGCPCVMLACPDAARFVLVTHAHLFRPTYPRSKEELIGPSALFFHQGDYHARLRKLVQRSLYPETFLKLIPDVEALAVSALESLSSQNVINTFQEMKKVSVVLYLSHNKSPSGRDDFVSFNQSGGPRFLCLNLILCFLW